jgi:hypothetical protein
MRISAKVQRYCLAAVFALAGLLVLPVAAQTSNTGRSVLSYQDRTEIQDLFYKYSYYNDNSLGVAWASTFTSDGKLEFPGTVLQGHDQLAAFGSKSKTRVHFVGSILLTQTAAGHVHARSMVLTAMTHADAPLTFEGIGIYDDQIVKTPAGWRFLLRHADSKIPVSSDFLP